LSGTGLILPRVFLETLGLRFLHIEKNSEVALQSWLSSLEGQFQFRDSTRQIGAAT